MHAFQVREGQRYALIDGRGKELSLWQVLHLQYRNEDVSVWRVMDAAELPSQRCRVTLFNVDNPAETMTRNAAELRNPIRFRAVPNTARVTATAA